MLAEREAERAQLRADAAVVRHRRRQVILLTTMFAATFGVRWYVLANMRTEYSPGLFSVSLPGAIMLFSVYVIRGLAIVGLFNSPLRRGIGETLFRWFWLGSGGRAVLRVAGRRLAGGRMGSQTGAVEYTAPAVVTAAATLEARVQSLEQWRAAMDRHN